MGLASTILFFGACVGHVAILVYSLNWWYGLPLPHRILSTFRLLHGILVVVGVAGFGYAWFLFYPLTHWLCLETPKDLIAVGYTVACALVGWLIVPAITIKRFFRAKPSVLASNHTETFDVAAKLGFKPAARGRHWLLAHLPGNEIFKVDLAERVLRLPRLPAAWDRLTILHMTDLHFSGTPNRVFYQEVTRRCRDWDPDLVAITGDFVDGPYFHRWILPTLGWLRARVACFAVLGNHDSWYEPEGVKRRLEGLGIRVLDNSWTKIDVCGQPLVVVGHQGPWFRPGPDLSGCPDGPFRLCLSHTPDNIAWAKQNQIDLMLAGHVHGGQIRFPVIGSVLVPSVYSRRYDCGVFDEPPTVLHVSRGLGGQHPVRYNCRPEVTKLVLRATSPDSTESAHPVSTPRGFAT
jgi:predicted MPP superfamily phosphohydrolase